MTMKKVAAVALVLMVALAAFGLSACSGNGGGSGSNISNEVKADGKAVIKAASNVFAATESLDLTDKDSPATIDKNDPRFADFYNELMAYKTLEGYDVSDCSLVVKIQSVTAATARGDSTQTNYRYAIDKADMVVNGVAMEYDAAKKEFKTK